MKQPHEFQTGDHVIIRKHTTKKYEGEPGRIQVVTPQADPPYAVVLLYAGTSSPVAPLVPLANLELDTGWDR